VEAVGAQVCQTTLLDDDYVEVSIEALGFPKKMDSEK
jgi:hypothetical protein